MCDTFWTDPDCIEFYLDSKNDNAENKEHNE